MHSALSKLKRSWWFAWVIAIALALSQMKDVIGGIDQILIFAKIKPDALVLAQDAEKGEFSRSLAETAWNRIFWARAYTARLKMGAADSEVNEAWKAYIAASEVWSTRIMVYIVTTERFYGTKKSLELEGSVQTTLKQMGASLIELRYAESPSSVLFDGTNYTIDQANSSMYHFVRGFHEK
jgi:hypothetical protein